MDSKSKKVNIFVNSILNSLWLFGFCMVIMLFSLMFFSGEIDSILRFFLGVVMALPLCVLFYSRGNITATKEFTNRNLTINIENVVGVNKVPFWYGLVMITPFIVVLFAFVIIGNITGIYPFQNVALYVCLPSTICFKALEIIVTLEEANWMAVLAVGAFVFIMCSFYFLGFYKTLAEKEKSFKEMLNEVRFNSKF